MIPTRDELIERHRRRYVNWAAHEREHAADFALAEIRRAVAEELEALLRYPPGGMQERHAQARLAALRQTEQPNTAPPTTEDSQRRVAPSGSDLGGAVSREANLPSRPSDGRQHSGSGLAATFTDKPGAESQAHSSTSSERDDGRAASSPCPPPANPCPAEHRAPRALCSLLSGHHGRHRTSVGMEWPNENEQRPCTSTMAAALGVVGMPCLLRCGLLMDHDGQHVFTLSWEELRAAELELRQAKSRTCTWSRADYDTDLWEGSCGVAWSLSDGTPKENDMNYCPRCGAKLETQQS